VRSASRNVNPAATTSDTPANHPGLVHAGTRVCVDRSKRDLVEFGGYVGAYFLDDRAAVTALLRAAAA
jgi:putative aminopeptidase FrvX